MFKKPKRRAVRQPLPESDEEKEEEQEDVSASLDNLKQIQGLRKRSHGIDVDKLNRGEVKRPKETKKSSGHDLNVGGMTDARQMQQAMNESVTDDAYDTGIGTAFSAETNTRDEDAEMKKYIEEELRKRKGVKEDDGGEKSYMSPEESALMAVPEYLRASSAKKSEDMLSNQMLSGIPEVDLGLEAKISNIEATEAAKMKILTEQMKKDTPSQFVPANMAVNFRHHNRFNIRSERRRDRQKKEEKVEEDKPVLVVGGVRADERSAAEKKVNKQGQASDDDYYNRYRNRRFW